MDAITAGFAARRRGGSPNWMTVDLSILQSNYAELVRRAGGRKVVIAVKADGYGHGAVEVSKALAEVGCRAVWAGQVAEALAIRDHVPDLAVDVFAGSTHDVLPELLAAGLRPTVTDFAGALAAAAHGGSVNVKVDAGLGRLGVPIAQAAGVIRRMAALDGLSIVGIYSHLPFGDATSQAWAVEQAGTFARLLEDLATDGIRPAFTQLWGSAGLFADAPDPSNAVCVGHLAYGISHAPAMAFELGDIRPVVSELGSRLIHVTDHRSPHTDAAAPIMPGGYATRGAVRTGVIPLGISSGLRRFRPGSEPAVLIRGQRVPAIGTSLEHTVIDLSTIDNPQIGEPVVLVGESGTAKIAMADWADWLGCKELDAIIGFSGRVPRYRTESAPPGFT